MGIVKSYPVKKIVAGKEVQTSDSILCNSNYYKTNGESAIVINSKTECTLVLDETTTDHVTIKAMSDVKVVTDKLIDDKFEEILLEKYSSVELRYIVNSWYIMSSDGIKNS